MMKTEHGKAKRVSAAHTVISEDVFLLLPRTNSATPARFMPIAPRK